MVLETEGGDCKVTEIISINSDFKELAPSVVTIIPANKRRFLRNTMIVSLAYFFYFTGFWSLTNLQSTMNAEGGMGIDSQAAIYLCSMVSCFFPELLIEKFGTKNTYIVTLLLSLPYLAANFRLRWDAMMITSVLYGLVSGPYNAALSCYVDEMSSRYAAVSGESLENVESTFFGVYIFFSEFTQVVGNVIAYYSLVAGRPANLQNFSAECGIHFDPTADNGTNSNLAPPSDEDRYILIGSYLILGVLAVVIALFLDPLGNDMKEVRDCRSVSRKVTSAVKHLKKPHQLLLLPLTIFIGMEGPFYSADLTQVSLQLTIVLLTFKQKNSFYIFKCAPNV